MEEPKKVGDLTQSPLPFRRQRLELYEDRVELVVEDLLDRFRIPFYLHQIKDEPDRIRMVPWLRLAFAVVAAAGAAWLAAAGGAGERLLALALGAAGLGAFVLALPRLRPRLVYTYRPLGPEGPHTRYEPHLYLAVDRPSAEEVRAFAEKIAAVQKRHVERLKSEQEGEGGIGYARELERFATLREREVLTEHEYAQVKAKLLNLKTRRIGF